jgi:hypothetical protein
MNGHHYVTMRDGGGREVEFAFPAELMTSSCAIDAARAFSPGWINVGITWRASFDQRGLPANSQKDFQSGVHRPAEKVAAGVKKRLEAA